MIRVVNFAPHRAICTVLLLLAAVFGLVQVAEGADRPKLLWKVPTNDWVISLAVGPDGDVYAGTWTGGVVYVLSSEGRRLRQITLGDSNNYGVDELVVSSDRTIYARSINEQLYALAPDGELKWKKINVSGRALAVGQNGVYANSYALDPTTGEPTVKFPGAFLTLGDDGTVYIQDQVICAFEPGGQLKWKSRSDSDTPPPSGAHVLVGNDGTIYGNSHRSYVVRDPVTGARRYVRPPAGVPHNLVVAFDTRSGSIKWSFQSKATLPALAKGNDGTIYVGSYDGHVYALDPHSGELRWKFWTGGGWGKMPVHALTVGNNGTIYAGAGKFVEAIRPP